MIEFILMTNALDALDEAMIFDEHNWDIDQDCECEDLEDQFDRLMGE